MSFSTTLFLFLFVIFIPVIGVTWKCLRCSCSQQLETDLKIEREWRQTLQSDLDRERDTVSQLSTEALQINGLKKVRKERETNMQCTSYCAGFDACLLLFVF